MTNFGNKLEQYANGNLPACQHPINAVDGNNFCHKCGKQLEVSQNAGENYVEVLLTQNAEQAATIARLTAAHEMQGESLVVLPRWMVENMANKTEAINAAIEDIKIYCNNPSAWDYYDETVSQKISAILKAAGMA